MHFCCLGSGSRGNAYVVEYRNTTLLIDCGFSITQLNRRLKKCFLSINDIDAIFISHEHQDHTRGLNAITQHANINTYMTAGTANALKFKPTNYLKAGIPHTIRDMQITPIAIPHDACEPVQFIIDNGRQRLAIITDLGYITPDILSSCSQLHSIIIECNHESAVLAANKNYPTRVKNRITSDNGHLENHAAARFIADIDNDNLSHVIAAHLSQQNNSKALVRRALSTSCAADKIKIADQRNILHWLSVSP